MGLPPDYRVVTGHDSHGEAIVASGGPLPMVVEIQSIPGTVFHEEWSTVGTPAPIDNGADPGLAPLQFPTPSTGTRIRPDTPDCLIHGAARMQETFAQIGDVHASTVRRTSPHPLMHRTESVDYGAVIEGELVLVLDHAEVGLRPGSVVIQRGTNHAWANRYGRSCRVLSVLVEGAYEPGIRLALDAASEQ